MSIASTVAPWGDHRPNVLAKACIELLRRRIARGAAKRPFRALLRNLATDYDVEIDGLKLRCRMSDNYTEQMAIERAGHTNRKSIDLINNRLRPGDVFVDIGANCGLFTLFGSRGWTNRQSSCDRALSGDGTPAPV